MNKSFNKYVYIGFLLFGIYELLFRQSTGDAATYMGIALAFDPFNQEQPWKDRPTWQKAILITHLVFLVILIGDTIGNPTSDFRKGLIDGWFKK